MVQAAAQDAVRRMRRMWPAFAWGVEGAPQSAAAEYGHGLMSIGDAAAIRSGVTQAIRITGGRFPPPLADLLEFVRAERTRVDHETGNTPNLCPECDGDQGAVVDRNGIASCTNGLHRFAWRVSA